MRCCGSPFQQITMQSDAGTLTLLRCTHCAAQRWAQDGTMLGREQAFTELARAYREVPLRARAVRDRAAPVSSERQMARRAQRLEARNDRHAETGARPDAAGLMTMLDGWKVLGASA